MRILLMNQFFWPDSAATSQLLTDLAEEMAASGHEVHVICADGGYAVASSDKAPAVHIHRVPSTRYRRGVLGRMLAYLSFYLGAARLALALPRPELVLTLTTPPLLSLLGTLLKMLRGTRHFIWEMDVYPDVAVALGYFQAGGLLDRLTGILADFSRRRADGILALGECMKTLLVRRGVSAERIFIAENWADGSAIIPSARTVGTHPELVLLYSGNLGLAHDVDTLAGAMLALRDHPGFRFVFTGGGPRRKPLEQLCEQEGLRAVEFRPYAQRAALGESLGMGDIGVVTQQNSCCGAVVPSKVYGLLAAGRPVLFIGPAQSTPARIVREFGCGWHIACGDHEGLTALLFHLDAHRELVEAAGLRAREALLAHYDRPLGVRHICQLLAVPHTQDEEALSAPADRVLAKAGG